MAKDIEPDDWANLMKKLARAGWIDRSRVGGGKFECHFTPRGRRRMRSLALALSETGPLSMGEILVLLGLALP